MLMMRPNFFVDAMRGSNRKSQRVLGYSNCQVGRQTKFDGSMHICNDSSPCKRGLVLSTCNTT